MLFRSRAWTAECREDRQSNNVNNSICEIALSSKGAKNSLNLDEINLLLPHSSIPPTGRDPPVPLSILQCGIKSQRPLHRLILLV